MNNNSKANLFKNFLQLASESDVKFLNYKKTLKLSLLEIKLTVIKNYGNIHFSNPLGYPFKLKITANYITTYANPDLNSKLISST